MFRVRSFLYHVGALIAASTVLSASDVKADGAEYASPFSWTGFYAGLNGGYGWNDSSVDWGPQSAAAAPGNHVLNNAFGNADARYTSHSYSQSSDAEGGFVGGQFGYNLQFAKAWVAGLEADIQTGIDGDTSSTGTHTVFGRALNFTAASDQDLKYFGTVRGRLGVLATPNLLVFGTGGLAYGETESRASISLATTAVVASGYITPGSLINCFANVVCLAGGDKETSVGWTVGGGVEWAFLKNTMLKLEYLHVDLGSQTVRLTSQSPSTGNGFVTTKFENSFEIVRAGLNVKF